MLYERDGREWMTIPLSGLRVCMMLHQALRKCLAPRKCLSLVIGGRIRASIQRLRIFGVDGCIQIGFACFDQILRRAIGTLSDNRWV
jgi:hypothetical protein